MIDPLPAGKSQVSSLIQHSILSQELAGWGNPGGLAFPPAQSLAQGWVVTWMTNEMVAGGEGCGIRCSRPDFAHRMESPVSTGLIQQDLLASETSPAAPLPSLTVPARTPFVLTSAPLLLLPEMFPISLP